MTVAHLKYLQLHLFRKSYESGKIKDARITKVLDLAGKVYCL